MISQGKLPSSLYIINIFIKNNNFPSSSPLAWIWTATDYAEEEPTNESFAARFKTADIASQFKKAFDRSRERAVSHSPSKKGGAAPAKPAVSTPSTPATTGTTQQRKSTYTGVHVPNFLSSVVRGNYRVYINSNELINVAMNIFETKYITNA